MASVNKVIIALGTDDLLRMYVHEKKSIPLISESTGIHQSTIRFRLKRLNALRSRGDAIRLSATQGRIGSGNRGMKRVFSDQWKENISAAARVRGEVCAVGVSKKSSGYVEYTRGPNKGRAVHVVLIEEIIGRRIYPNEVVHHCDHDRSNNDNLNLELMTRSAHSSLHAVENYPLRRRAENGQFE